MKSEKKALFENFLSLGVLQIFSYIIPIITLPYQARVLGPDKFGLVNFAYAFMAYFCLLTDWGFGLSAVREIAVNRHNKNNISHIFSAVTCSKIALTVVSYILLVICSFFIPKIHDNWLIFQLTFVMVIGSAIYPVWFFLGMERMKYITFLNVIARLFFLIAIFIFVKQESDYVLVPLLNSLGFLVSGIIGIYFSVKHLGVRFCIPKLKFIIKQFKYSNQFFLSRVSLSAYTNTNAFCLGLIGSNIMVGYYAAAEKIYQAISNLQSPVHQALYPFVSKNKDIKTYKKWVLVALLCNIVACGFVFLIAKPFTILFYGEQMVEAYKILRIFCVIAMITFPSVLIGFPLLGAFNHTKEANMSVVAGSILHITGLTLLYLFGIMNIYSIALMVLVTESIVFSIRAYYVWKYKLLKENQK